MSSSPPGSAHMETAAVLALALAAGASLPWWVAAGPTAVVVAPHTDRGEVVVAMVGVWAVAVAMYAVWEAYHDDVAVVMALLCAWRASVDDLSTLEKKRQ